MLEDGLQYHKSLSYCIRHYGAKMGPESLIVDDSNANPLFAVQYHYVGDSTRWC